MSDDKPFICRCGTPNFHAASSQYPVSFIRHLNEYVIDDGRVQIRLDFCYRCGGKLPASRRDEQFLEIQEREKDEVLTALAGATTILEVCSRLGEPSQDVAMSPDPPPHLQAVRAITYKGRWHSFELTVFGLADNTYALSFVPKRKIL